MGFRNTINTNCVKMDEKCQDMRETTNVQRKRVNRTLWLPFILIVRVMTSSSRWERQTPTTRNYLNRQPIVYTYLEKSRELKVAISIPIFSRISIRQVYYHSEIQTCDHKISFALDPLNKFRVGFQNFVHTSMWDNHSFPARTWIFVGQNNPLISRPQPFRRWRGEGFSPKVWYIQYLLSYKE